MWLLTVPKTVAITNPRLNIMYYALMLATLIFIVWSFFNSQSFSTPIPTETRCTISTLRVKEDNISTHRLCPTDAAALSRLSLPGGFEYSTDGSSWEQASSNCLPVCSTGEDGKDRVSCVSSSTFVYSRSSQEVALFAARHVVRNNGTHKKIDSLLGLSAVGAKFRFTYRYELAEAVPYLASYLDSASGSGTDAKARTVVLSSEGSAYRTFDPGEVVSLTLREVLQNVDGLPQQYRMHAGEDVPWEVFRDGIELSMRVQCYNDDAEIADTQLRIGASNAKPSCFLAVVYVRCCPDFGAWQVRSDNGVVVDRAVLIRTRSGLSSQWFLDSGSAVVGLTSALVLFGLPMKIMRWFALIALGTLSTVYRRVLVQTFDLAEQTATMAVLLMSNSVSFMELSDVNSKDSGHPGISRARFEERLKQALQQRRDVLDEAELSAFVDCCFNSMRPGTNNTFFKLVKNSFGGFFQRKDAGKYSSSEEAVCDIDTFNVHCSYDSAVDLDTAVSLFDRDRRQGFVERMFTPDGVIQSLNKVREVRKTTDPDSYTSSRGAESTGSGSDFVTEAIRRSTLEDKRKSVEAQQRRHEREINVLDTKIKQIEFKLTEQGETPTGDNLLREATERFEGRLKQLETAIEASEYQVRPLWTAVHQALSSMGERVHAVDVRLRDIANAQPPAVLMPSGDFTGPLPQTTHQAKSQALSQSREAEFAVDEWRELFEDLKNRLVSIEAQMKHHIQHQQTVGIELVERQEKKLSEREAGIQLAEKQVADREERFMTAVDTKIGRRVRKMEEDVRELIKANQLVTPTRADNQVPFDSSPQGYRVDGRPSPRMSTSPRPLSAPDTDVIVEEVAEPERTFRSSLPWSGRSSFGISTPTLSARRGGSQAESHDGNGHSEAGGKPTNVRYQACIWP